jgi:crotonobetainyl-CoA:carnitine CoA-transferase CaiB-like acyl-CoA transferase
MDTDRLAALGQRLTRPDHNHHSFEHAPRRAKPGPRDGSRTHRDGSRAYLSAPPNVYRTADDRPVAISTSAQSAADRLFGAIGRADLIEAGRYDTTQKRIQHADELDGLIADSVTPASTDYGQSCA